MKKNILLFLQEIQAIAKDYPTANVYIEEKQDSESAWSVGSLSIDEDGDIIIKPIQEE